MFSPGIVIVAPMVDQLIEGRKKKELTINCEYIATSKTIISEVIQLKYFRAFQCPLTSQ